MKRSALERDFSIRGPIFVFMAPFLCGKYKKVYVLPAFTHLPSAQVQSSAHAVPLLSRGHPAQSVARCAPQFTPNRKVMF